jgi:hypothetical protein
MGYWPAKRQEGVVVIQKPSSRIIPFRHMLTLGAPEVG